MYIIRQISHPVKRIWLHTYSLAAGPCCDFHLAATASLKRVKFRESSRIIAAITEERNPTLQMNARVLSWYGLMLASCSRTYALVFWRLVSIVVYLAQRGHYNKRAIPNILYAIRVIRVYIRSIYSWEYILEWTNTSSRITYSIYIRFAPGITLFNHPAHLAQRGLQLGQSTRSLL